MCCCCCVPDCCLVILALIFPPLPVIIKKGLCSCDFLINVCLCLLGWIPGTIHSWYIILSSPDKLIDDEERQIFIINTNDPNYNPNNKNNLTIHKQPNQTKIRFSHPEPFLESNNNSRNNSQSINQNNNLNNNLSPLSHIVGDFKCQTSFSPSNNNNNNNDNNYGSTNDGDIDPLNESNQPPSYENVMNETSKQFK